MRRLREIIDETWNTVQLLVKPVPQPVPEPVPEQHVTPETLMSDIEKLDTDNEEDQIKLPKLASRVCGPPPQYRGNVGSETPLNLSAAEALEEETWTNSAPFLTRPIPAGMSPVIARMIIALLNSDRQETVNPHSEVNNNYAL